MFKYFLLSLLLIGTVKAVDFLPTSSIETLLTDEKVIQQDELTGKYIQIKETIDPILGKYAVHEYVIPDGQAGYQLFRYDEQGRLVESVDSGLENYRNFSIIYDDTIVASSTPKE